MDLERLFISSSVALLPFRVSGFANSPFGERALSVRDSLLYRGSRFDHLEVYHILALKVVDEDVFGAGQEAVDQS